MGHWPSDLCTCSRMHVCLPACTRGVYACICVHALLYVVCTSVGCFIHLFHICLLSTKSFPDGSDSKESVFKVGDLGSIPGSGRSPGEENGNPLQYSCLENSMDRGVWWATGHGVAKSQTVVHGVAESGTTERLILHFDFIVCWTLYLLLGFSW